MFSEIYKFGDSLFLRLPKSFVVDNELAKGSILRLRTEGQIIKIKVRSRPVYLSESEFIDLVGTVESVCPDLEPESSQNSNDILKKL
ncbi:MAG: hypothetical protein M0P09_06215 [Acholeplasmataceae bacterium]|nr:hypothetical protein [Acholeplasmataceae bacterium]